MCECVRVHVCLWVFRVLLIFFWGGGELKAFPAGVQGIRRACLLVHRKFGIFPAGLWGILCFFLLVFGEFGVFSCWSSGNLGPFPAGFLAGVCVIWGLFLLVFWLVFGQFGAASCWLVFRASCWLGFFA